MKKSILLSLFLMPFLSWGQYTRIEPEIGILSPNNILINTTTPTSFVPPLLGAGTRLMWMPAKGAFRVGTVEGTEWDNLALTPIGVNSFGAGINAIASGEASFVVGKNNTASAWASAAFGYGTNASGYASVAFGLTSKASGAVSAAFSSGEASGVSSFATGSCIASEELSTAIGTRCEARGKYSTAMGAWTKAAHEGCFMIGDNTGGYLNYLTSTTTNRFYARFSNGYTLYTNSNNTVGVSISGGGNSWSVVSDSTKKENFIPANEKYVLESVAKMRVGTWNYKGQNPAHFRHWGPMAQDFYTYFGNDSIGTIGNNTSIASADMDGVLFTAIKALENRTKIMTDKIATLESQNAELKATISGIYEMLSVKQAQKPITR